MVDALYYYNASTISSGFGASHLDGEEMRACLCHDADVISAKLENWEACLSWTCKSWRSRLVFNKLDFRLEL